MLDGSPLTRVDRLINLAAEQQPHSRDAAARELIAAAAAMMGAEPMKQICEIYALASECEVFPIHAGDDAHERESFYYDCALRVREASEELAEHYDTIGAFQVAS